MSLEPVNINKYGFSILQIETISICNMECQTCIYPIRNDKGEILPEKEILNIVDSICIDDKFEYTCFSHFNEPLLDNRIYNFIRYAKDKKLPVMIITNGLLFNSKIVIDKLIYSNPDYIKISLQTVNPKLFHDVRHTENSFQEYKKGIFEFLKCSYGISSKIIIDVACNFLSTGKRFIKILFGVERGDPSIYDTIDDLRIDVKSFLSELQIYDNRFIFEEDELDNYLDKVKPDYLDEKGFSLAKNISVKIKPFSYGRKLTEFYPAKDKIGCRNRILGILANGNVVPCCLAYDDMLSMGNIKKDSLKTILERNTHWLDKLRKGIDLPLYCQRCLGAPSKRGTYVKYIKNKLLSR